MSSGNHWIGTNIVIHDSAQARTALATASLRINCTPADESPITTALDRLGISWATETTHQIILREPENDYEMPAKTYNTLRTLIITLAPHISTDGTIHEQTGHITY